MKQKPCNLCCYVLIVPIYSLSLLSPKLYHLKGNMSSPSPKPVYMVLSRSWHLVVKDLLQSSP